MPRLNLTAQAELLLRRLRNDPRLFDGPDADRISRALTAAKARVIRRRARFDPAPPVGRYSGLTRAELRRSGTCETDWY